MMKSILLAAAMVGAIPLAVAAPKKSAPVFDPVPAFQNIVLAAGGRSDWSAVHQNSRDQKWVRQFYKITPPTYDVRKTDSLVNPMIGLVEFRVAISTSARHDSEDAAISEDAPIPDTTRNYKVAGTYHVVNSEWKLQNFAYTSTDRGNVLYNTTYKMDPSTIQKEVNSGFSEAFKLWVR